MSNVNDAQIGTELTEQPERRTMLVEIRNTEFSKEKLEQIIGDALLGASRGINAGNETFSVISPFQALKNSLEDDLEQQWGWVCNLAVPIMYSAGLSHKASNETAANLMSHLFDIDVTNLTHYKYDKTDAQKIHEIRMMLNDKEHASEKEISNEY